MNDHKFPAYTERERAADRWVHRAGLTFAPVAVTVLLGAAALLRDGATVAVLAVYGAGLLAMIGCSAWYNLETRPARREVVRRLDHAAIYLMIAGTYTPFAVRALPEREGAILLAVVWAVALAGAALKLAAPRRFETLGVVAYLALGWSIVPLARPLFDSVPVLSFALLMAGGVIYTAGVGVHLWRALPYQNAAWHALVLVAAACHYAAVADTALFAG